MALPPSAGSLTALVCGWGCSMTKEESPAVQRGEYSTRTHARAGRGSKPTMSQLVVAYMTELLEPDSRTKAADEVKLHMLGYRQELSRDLTLFNVLGVAVSTLSYFWVAGTVLPYGMIHGGPVSVVWGWVVASLFNTIVSVSYAEIASAYPTSGALYYACWAMAPPRIRRFSCYFVAWMNLMAQVSLTVFNGISLTFVVQELVELCTEASTGVPYIFTSTENFGIYCGIVISQAIIISGRQAVSSFMYTAGMLWHIVPFITIVASMLWLAPSFQPSTWVWTGWEPNTEVTGITSPLLTFLLGIQTAQLIFVGYDGPIHLSEETLRASVVTPAAVVLTVVITAVFGWVFLLAMMYSVQDPTGANSPPTQDFLVLTLFSIFQARYGQGSLSAPMMVIPTVAGYFSSFCALAVNARFVYAIARDGAFPFSAVLSKVHDGTKVPLAALWFSVLIAVSVAALCLHVPIVLATFLALSANAAALVMAVPLLLRAYLAFSNDTVFLAGPFNLGWLGAPIAAVGAAWLLLVTVIFALPSIWPPTATDMNYTSVPLAGMVVMTVASWFCPRFGARHWFNGPKSTLGVGLRSASGDPPATEGAPGQSQSAGRASKHPTVLQRFEMFSSFSFASRKTRVREQEIMELQEQQMYRRGRMVSVHNGSVRGGGMYNGSGQVKVELAAATNQKAAQPAAAGGMDSDDDEANNGGLAAVVSNRMSHHLSSNHHHRSSPPMSAITELQ